MSRDGASAARGAANPSSPASAPIPAGKIGYRGSEGFEVRT